MKPIFLLGEARGENEDRINSSFVGPSGIELLRMLDEAKIIELTPFDRDYISRYYNEGKPELIDAVWQLHPEVYRSNVFEFHPPGNYLPSLFGDKASGIPGYPSLKAGAPPKTGYIHHAYARELDRLGDELVRLDPNLILALGNTALWALAGKTGVAKLRGTTTESTHTVTGFKLLPTYHPAAILRQWELRPVTVMDFVKAKREAEFPDVRRPRREIWIEPGLDDIQTFHDRFIRGCSKLSVDIETSGSQITCIGFAPDAERAIVIPFVDERAKGKSYWSSPADERAAWKIISDIVGDGRIPKLFQNGLYDIAFLWRSYGIAVYGAEHDTMLLHHSIQPESLKSLGFLGSIYTDEGPWKHERKGTSTIKRDE